MRAKINNSWAILLVTLAKKNKQNKTEIKTVHNKTKEKKRNYNRHK